jgi:hypothetical protein
MEGSLPTKGNSPQQNIPRIQGRERMQSALERVRQRALKDKKLKFTSLMHHITAIDTLREAYYSLKRDASAGIDGQTWRRYEDDLEENLQDLSGRLKRGAYRAKPVRRVYIPKADGSAILKDEPIVPRSIRPDLPSGLEETILKLLEKDFNVRTQSAAELRADLIRVKRQIALAPGTPPPQRSSPTNLTPPQQPPSSDREIAVGLLRRHFGAITATCVAVVCIGVLVAWFTRRADQSPISSGDIEIQPLTTTGDASQGVISPDGKFIAYLRKEGSGESVWVQQLATGSAQPVKRVSVDAPAVIYGLTVTPDSQEIDYVVYPSDSGTDRGDLFRTPAINGPARKITSNVWSAIGWSNDGKTMAFVREFPKEQRSEIVLANAEGGDERILATLKAPALFLSNYLTSRPTSRPSWSPDDKSLMVLDSWGARSRRKSPFLTLQQEMNDQRSPRRIAV